MRGGPKWKAAIEVKFMWNYILGSQTASEPELLSVYQLKQPCLDALLFNRVKLFSNYGLRGQGARHLGFARVLWTRFCLIARRIGVVPPSALRIACVALFLAS